MARRSGGHDRGRGDPLTFEYPDVGPRFQESADETVSGLRSGRFWLRLVAGAVLATMLVLIVAGRGDAAAGIGWVLLGPLVVVLAIVELTALFSDSWSTGD